MMLSLQMICYLIENFNELQEDEAIFDDNFDVVYSNDSSESSKNGIDEKKPKVYENKNEQDVFEQKERRKRKERKNKAKSNFAFKENECINTLSKELLKGSKLDDKKHTVCLDCGKSFALRSSYILHTRL